MSTKEVYYSVHRGKEVGIYKTWEETKKQVHGFTGAKYRKFTNQSLAVEYLATGVASKKVQPKQTELSKYFKCKERGLERYGILVRDTHKEDIPHQDKMFADTVVAAPSEEDPWGDYPREQKILIFTDGSCIEVKKSACRRAGIGIHFPQNICKDVCETLPGKPTNQRAELYAIQRSLELVMSSSDYVENRQRIYIFTDSEYSIKCITKWHKTWLKNQWKTSSGKSVENKDLIEPVLDLLKKTRVTFKHVRAHTGKTDRYSLGNHAADRLAFQAASAQIKH